MQVVVERLVGWHALGHTHWHQRLVGVAVFSVKIIVESSSKNKRKFVPTSGMLTGIFSSGSLILVLGTSKGVSLCREEG